MMMDRLFAIALITMPATIYAQGVKFENNKSWDEIRMEAMAENKYIFVDCFASWCGPCKRMDKDVYLVDSLGRYMNDRFISVKLQFDTTAGDGEETKMWYPVAHAFTGAYSVHAYPTFIFFSPAGVVLTKNIGFKSAGDLVELARSVLDSSNQYYTLVRSYDGGRRNYPELIKLAVTAKRIDDIDLSRKIARDVVENYLNRASDSEILRKSNLEFVGKFEEVMNSSDRAFAVVWQNPDEADRIEGKGFAYALINYMVFKEIINPSYDQAVKGRFEPNWHRLQREIIAAYDHKDLGEEDVWMARVRWYKQFNHLSKYIKYLVKKVDKYDLGDTGRSLLGNIFLNNDAFEVFKFSKKTSELRSALRWIDLAIAANKEPNPSFLDTKANILYRMGHTKEAIAIEERVLTLASGRDSTFFSETLTKMKNGDPTWTL